MKKVIQIAVICAFSALSISCYHAERTMYTKKNESGILFLSHYTSIFPTLGPCGFSRPEDDYEITISKTIGKIPASHLRILKSPDENKFIYYTGYIEFIDKNIVFVDLYRNDSGMQIPLTINGRHKISVKSD